MTLSEASLFPLIWAAVLLLVTSAVVNWWKRNRKLPPGPWGLPVVGYYPFVSGKLYKNFTPLSKKYGEVFSFRTVGGRLVVVVNGPKTIKEVLVSRSDEFNGRPRECNALYWISDGLGLIQEEGVPWKEQRRFFLHTVKNYGFGRVESEESIQDEIRTLLDVMRSSRGDPTNFEMAVSYLCHSVISRILFGKKVKRDENFSRLVDDFQILQSNFSSHRFLLVGPYFQYLGIKYFPWSPPMRRARQSVQKIFRDIVGMHIKEYDPNHLKDFVDSYLHEMKRLKQNGELEISTFTLERLIAISMNMTIEATETATAAILCLLLEAAKHPREQKLAQEELDSVVGRDRLPSWLDRHKLPYLEAFIQELHRTGQSFYTTAQYSNYETTTINGFLIPKRSIIYANLWTINNDSINFPKPEKFDVGRFLDENGKKIKTEGPYPFGLGKRDCPGQSLASMEIFLILSAVLQNFNILSGTEPETLRVIERSNISLPD